MTKLTAVASDPSPPAGSRCAFDFTRPMPEDVQRAAALLLSKGTSLWVFGNPEVEARWRMTVETGYECLLAEPPNVVAAQEIAERVQAAIEARVANMRRDGVWQRWSLASLGLVLLGVLAVAGVIPRGASVVSIPAWVFLFGAAGGAASGLVALRSRLDCAQGGKLAVFSAALRPILGSLTGVLAYLLFASGAVSITVGTQPQLFYALASLAGGFSERLLGHALGQTVGFLGSAGAFDDETRN